MSSLDYPRQLLAIGDNRGAEKELMRLIRSNAKDIDAWLLLAQAMDDPERKADCYRMVIQLDPKNLPAQEELRKIINAILQQPGQAESPAKISPIISETATEQERRTFHPTKKPAKSLQQANPIGRRIGVSPTELKILVVTALSFIVLITALLGFTIFRTIDYNNQATQTAVAAQGTASAYMMCRLQFEDEMTDIFSRFFRQQLIAETTSRINLPEQISRLEDIRNEAWSMQSKSCARELHPRFMDYLDKTISSYVAFSGDDYSWEDKYNASLDALVSLDDAVIANGHPGGLVELFRTRGYFYWDILDDPKWKDGKSG